MKTALVIMAAGIGSRFQGGVKQLTPVGPNGELIIDYSIYDALQAGFHEIIFIIRREIEAAFRAEIGDRIAAKIGKVGNLERVSYVYQELENLPSGFDRSCIPAARHKPWGTGHAVLSCLGAVHGPFAVINADDYYGKHAFSALHSYLLAHGDTPGDDCMAGFILKNTLSDFGSVTRGLCRVDASGKLSDIQETTGLVKTGSGAASASGPVDPDTLVSMNMWGFTPDFLPQLEDGFSQFLKTADLEKDEYLLPSVVASQIQNGNIQVTCLKTQDSWFGVTYREDKPLVQQKIRALVESGAYPTPLWNEA